VRSTNQMDVNYSRQVLDRLEELESGNFGLNYRDRQEYDFLKAEVSSQIAKEEYVSHVFTCFTKNCQNG